MKDPKAKNFVFTWNDLENEKTFILDHHLFKLLEDLTESFCFQKEVGETTGRLHWQGMFQLKSRTLKSTLLNRFKKALSNKEKIYGSGYEVQSLTIDAMKGRFSQALEYVTKSETRVPGSTPYHSRDIILTTLEDCKLFENREMLYPWQETLFEYLLNEKGYFNKPHERRIIWITDEIGNSGKSKFVKYICQLYPNSAIKLPFGTTQQLRAAIISAGVRRLYFIDIPRTQGWGDRIDDILSVVEDIKNGFVVSSMYGKFQQLIYDPPHVVVFSNQVAPVKLLSSDRWITYVIKKNYLLKQ